MGSCFGDSVNKRQYSTNQNLSIVTLNYGGVINSPYQFYNDKYAKQLEDIGKIFVSMAAKYLPRFNDSGFNWSHGKIQLRFKKKRYSPLLNPSVGIENDKFINRKRFEELWDESYKKYCPETVKTLATPKEIQQTKLYDLIAYHSLLAYCYGDNKELKQLTNEKINKYQEFARNMFSLSFLDEQKKLEKINKSFGINKPDIFIVEEYTAEFQKSIYDPQNYYIARDKENQTMILAKKSCFLVKKEKVQFFDELKVRHTNKQFQFLDGNGIATLYLDNYIIMGVHLSSKPEKNSAQIKQLKELLLTLRRLCKNHHIICSGDLNSYLGYDQSFTDRDFHMYPNKFQEYTTIKKRTSIQGQPSKAEKIVIESKDKLMSDLPIINQKICYINQEKPKEKGFIPTDQHPSDHFVVMGDIKTRP